MGREPRKVSELLPDWLERMIKSLDDLENALQKYGVKVYRSYETPEPVRKYTSWGKHGYFSYGIGSMMKILDGNMLVEMRGETVRANGPQVYEYRDFFWHLFDRNPGASWISYPSPAPSAEGEASKGPWVMGAEVKILDEKNILMGHGVPNADAINDKSIGRSASDENTYRVFKAFAERLGYTVHQGYYDSNICFHMDCMVGLIKPGVIAIPEDGFFVMPDYIKENYQIIETDRDEAKKNLSMNIVNVNDDVFIINKFAEKTIDVIEKATGSKAEPIDFQVGADFGSCVKCCFETIWRER